MYGGKFVRKNFVKLLIIASIILLNSSHNTILNAEVKGNSYNSCYEAGEKALAISDFTVAAENFAEAIKYKPEDFRARLKYAKSLYSLKKYEESNQQLQIVLQNSPNNIMARINLAENYIQLEKKDLAKEQLDWILKVQPNHQKAKSLYESFYSDNTEKENNKNNSIYINEETTINKETTVNEDNISIVVPKKEEKIDNPPKVEKTEEIKVEEKTESIKEEENNISTKENLLLEKKDKSFQFTPYISGSKKKSKNPEESRTNKLLPKAKLDIKDTDINSFLKQGKDSFIVNLEKARYEIEKGDLKTAEKTVETADKIARTDKNSRNILEAQIFKSLIYVYQCDFNKFGKHLMTLKPALSKESYQSFLDVFSKSNELKTEDDKKRLAASVAIGAGHYAVVSNLLKPVFEHNPDEPIIYAMLSEAQLGLFDYNEAEKTLKTFAETHSNSAEAQFNLARFYLTAKYNPELARKYANETINLIPNDARSKILIALIDYSEGKIEEGINKIKEIMPNLEDNSMKAICQRILSDGEKNTKTSSKNFISVLALPCSEHSDSSSLRFAGEDDLKNGSYFSALEKFKKADELVEMGRVYLGLASALNSDNETYMASIAAGYGLKLIKEDMSRGKHIARASLYKALYDVESGDKESAIATIDLGLNCKDLDFSTYNKLVSLYDTIN